MWLGIAACALPAIACDRSDPPAESHAEGLAVVSPSPPRVEVPAPELAAEPVPLETGDEEQLALVAAASFGPDSEPIYHVGGEVLKPEKISGDDPDLVPLMQAHRIRGVTIFQLVITTEGRVRDVRFLKLGASELEQPIREAVETWRFEPATLRGQPVAVYYNMTIHIRLQ